MTNKKATKLKRQPFQRWTDRVDESYAAFLVSDDLKGLRKLGRRALRIRGDLSLNVWLKRVSAEASNEEYLEFRRQCAQTARQFGLSPDIVEGACIVKSFDPRSTTLGIGALENGPPQWGLVVGVLDPRFLSEVRHHGYEVGVFIAQSISDGEVGLVPGPIRQPLEIPVERLGDLPPLDEALRVRVNLPITYPPEAASSLLRTALKKAREVARLLGYDVPERLRTSKNTEVLTKLRLDEDRLEPRGTGDIAEDIFGEGSGMNSRLTKRIKDARHRARKRFRRVQSN